MAARDYWSDERISILKQLWTDGWSAAQIMPKLGGPVTRSAVLGKIHRMGLSRTKGRRQGQRFFKGEKASFRAPNPNARPKDRREQRQRLPSGALPPLVIPADQADAAIPLEQRKTLLQLSSSTCRWPVGDPGSAEFFFCGAVPKGEHPYCERHCDVAYDGIPAHRVRPRSSYAFTPNGGLIR